VVKDLRLKLKNTAWSLYSSKSC